MEIILLERYKKLGNIGEVVNVKDGFARNYLIPQSKALRATKANKEIFEAKKVEIKKAFDKKVQDAIVIQKALADKHIFIIKQASEDDRLYGSVNSSEIVIAIKNQLSQEILRSAVDMSVQIKYLGIYDIVLHVFADVEVTIKLIVARSKEEEAKFLAELKGENSKKKEKVAASDSLEQKENQEEILSEETISTKK